jgi:DNA-directed RNA polymerase alpha subunit
MAVNTNIFQNLNQVDPLTIKFTLSPTDHVYANTLRRAILSEVETVGFRSNILEDGSTSHVVIQKNNTPMTNEMLADRIGLLPIFVDPYADKEAWKVYDDNGNEVPPRYLFKLEKKSESETPTDVFASDFEVFQLGEGSELRRVENKQFFRSDPYMLKLFPSRTDITPLITTLKGIQSNQVPQEISLTARASIGTGRDHVRFSPVSQCSYQNTIDTDEGKQKAVFETWLRTTKKVDPSKVQGELEKTLKREFGTMEIERCFLKDENDLPYSFDFTIESRGQLDVKVIVARALEALIEKCKFYTAMESGDLPSNVEIRPADWTGIGYDFVIQQEDYTLGYLLQTWMDANLMPDEKGANGKISFVAAKIPHPLRDEMVIRIGFSSRQKPEETSILAARAVFAQAAKACMNMFTEWGKMWSATLEGKKLPAPAVPAKKKFKVSTSALPDTSSGPSWGNIAFEEERAERKAAATTAAPGPEVVKGVPKGVSKEQPAPKVDKRRGTFWKKNPLEE